MKAPAFRVLATVTEYTRFYGLPAPLHPLVTIVDLASLTTLPRSAALAAATTPVVLHLYLVSLKRNLRGLALRYGHRTYDFNEGVLGFVGPGQGCWAAESPTEADLLAMEALSGWVLVFHPDLLRPYPLAKKMGSYGFFAYQVHEALHLSPPEEQLLDGVVAGLQAEALRPVDAFSEELLVTQLDVLLTYANRFYHRQFLTRRTAEHDQLGRFEALLTAYFDAEDNPPLPTVQHFAQALHLSPTYLSDMLRALTGQTAQQHLHRALLEKAKHLLLTTSLSIKETAFRLGFDYPPYFSRLFKRKAGLTPAAFRRRHR